MNKKLIVLFFIASVALTNYQIAKVIQTSWLEFWPDFSYQWALVIPWFCIGALPSCFVLPQSGFSLNIENLRANWKILLSLALLLATGLLLFVLLGITKSFHSVKYPLIFFLATPLIEEILFRGGIYGLLQKIKLEPVLFSAIFFGLHHLQYFGYQPTTFAIFQIGYTFLLGIIFGLMRKKSDSMYPSLLAHVTINFVSVYF